jgi:hypothetical protein
MRSLREIFHWRPPWAQRGPPPLKPDCLLCPGKAVPHGSKLLGMDVCVPCTLAHLCDQTGRWVDVVPRDSMSWAIKVHYVRQEQALESYPLRIATRMTLARIMGLEVDLADLHDFSYPRISGGRRWNDG